MPIYEYQCQSCKSQSLEKLQRISDEPADRIVLPVARPELQASCIGGRFSPERSAGWYETDFKKGDKKNLHDSGTAKSAESSGKQHQIPADSPRTPGKRIRSKTESKPKPTKTSAD